MAWGTLRIGEAMGLQRSDLDLAQGGFASRTAVKRALQGSGRVQVVTLADGPSRDRLRYGPVSCSPSHKDLVTPLRRSGSPPPPAASYRGPWRLPGSDLHRLANMSFAASVVSYVIAAPSTVVAPTGVSAHPTTPEARQVGPEHTPLPPKWRNCDGEVSYLFPESRSWNRSRRDVPGAFARITLPTRCVVPSTSSSGVGVVVARHRFDDWATRRLTVTPTFVWSRGVGSVATKTVELSQ